MRKIFNIIPSKDSCCILLYGEIGEGARINSADVIRELMEAESTYKKIDVRINSNGGEVYTGIAIFNAFRQSKADITIYVDGIAASMASVIALCGKPVYMSKYARLMLHSVSGAIYGNKDDVKNYLSQMESLEDTLCEMYANRLGESKEQIKERYFDGDNHWIKAQDALAMGLIDGIYDTEPVAEDASTDDIYTTFNNRLVIEPQNQTEMDLKDFKQRPRFSACTTFEDVLKVIDTLEAENAAYKEAETQRQNAEVNALLDAAEHDGRINAATRPTFEALLKADRTNGENALNALSKKRDIMDDIHNEGNSEKGAWEKRQKEISDKLKHK